MKKVLKIRFVKFKIALAMQVLEMEGKFSDSKHVKIGNTRFCYDSCTIGDFLYMQKDNLVGVGYFGKNEQRDKYLDKVIKWISEEQFATTDGELEVGKMCYVSPFEQPPHDNWPKGKLLAILPARIENRYLIEDSDLPEGYSCWEFARPVNPCIRPKINNDTYTWEMETK